MDVGSLLLAFALLVVVLAFIARPLVEQVGEPVSDQEQEVSSLLAERERVLDALQELDMDRAMRKVLEQDYQEQRAQFLKEGAQILRRLDELGEQGAQVFGDRDAIEEEIEAEVARIRLESGEQEEHLYCPSCGQKALADDRFCTDCGQALPEFERE